MAVWTIGAAIAARQQFLTESAKRKPQVTEGRSNVCPCGNYKSYPCCCEPLHRGSVGARTAEQLMRSRYSAYVLKLIDYLYQTTHPDNRTEKLHDEIAVWAEQVEFLRLEILSVQQGLSTDRVGKVEFIAHFRQQQQSGQLHERSRFRRYRGGWVYFDGEIR